MRRSAARPAQLGAALSGLLVVLAGATAFLVALAGPTAAAAPSVTPGERITSFTVELAMQADGRLRVTETVSYDFGGNRRHGLLAYLPRRAIRAPDFRHYRQWPVHDLTTSADGRPALHTEEVSGDDLVIKVGDPEATVTGPHRYVLSFVVDGAFDTYGPPDPHDELYWNAVGAVC